MKLAPLIAAAALSFAASLAQALTLAPYSAEALVAAQKAGEPVALLFHSSWCPVCRTQERVLTSMQFDPSLNLTVLKVDFDTEADLRKQLKVRSQSTLIVYRGATERTRVYGEMQPQNLKAALQTALPTTQ